MRRGRGNNVKVPFSGHCSFLAISLINLRLRTTNFHRFIHFFSYKMIRLIFNFTPRLLPSGTDVISFYVKSLIHIIANAHRFCSPIALWARMINNPSVSTGPLADLFAHLLAPLTRLLATHYSLHLRAPLRSFALLTRSLHSLPHSWNNESFDGYFVFLSILAHSEVIPMSMVIFSVLSLVPI